MAKVIMPGVGYPKKYLDELKNKLELLAENPTHPSLRTKHMQGMKDRHTASGNEP